MQAMEYPGQTLPVKSSKPDFNIRSFLEAQTHFKKALAQQCQTLILSFNMLEQQISQRLRMLEVRLADMEMLLARMKAFPEKP